MILRMSKNMAKFKIDTLSKNRIIQYFVDLTLGGVFGLGLFIWAIFCSTGFSIWNEQIRLSSTLIRAPELLNYPQ